MQIFFKPKHPFSKDYSIHERDLKMGFIRYPWGQIFMNYGRADIVIMREEYTVSFPIKNFGYIGENRIVPMNLYKEHQLIARIHYKETDLVEELTLEIDGKSYLILMIGGGEFQIFDEDEIVGELKFSGFLLKKCHLRSPFSFIIDSLILFAINNPPKWQRF